MKTIVSQRYNPWGKTKRDQLQSWNILTFDPQKTDVDQHIDLINALGNMLGQTAESKMERFVDTMPTIIQTHLITCENWEKTTKKAKELEHIIRKCDPLAAAQPTLTQGTAVSGLYSHITHLKDKEETDIPHSFKGAKPKQVKNRGRGKGKQPQQKPNHPPVQIQDEQYTYEDTNNYYHNENYRGQSRGHRPYRGKHTGRFFRGQNYCGRGQRTQNPYQGQYQSNNYQGNNYQGNHGLYDNPRRGYQQGNNYGQLEAEAMVMVEVLTMDVVTAGLIIEAITTINTITIMVMMMTTSLINMVHHVHYVVAIIIPLNIVLRENMILTT